ncbi:MAG TPA: RagB/SusD family nutrient uptake outer membrane protein [Gemmatimonadaceae bacterium]|nr:RagB/SusD family nutrient uptake outer membrane protein [Gemmatimonadaceae bacterium]
MRIVSQYRLLKGAALAIVAGAALYGCNDFLSKAAIPEGTLDQGTLSTPAGVEGSLIAAYRQLDCTNISGAWGCAVSNWAFGSVTSDDAYEGSEANDQPPIEALEEYHWATADAQSYLNDKWVGVYEGISRANATLRLLKTVAAQGAMSADNVNGVAGEAIFLRAHYHFEAWRFWGNVPYYREDDTDFRKANETSDQVYADLIKDLDSAIKLLPTSPRNGQKGRATRWTAKAYKGRVQIYAGKFPEALITLRDVYQNGPYALEQSFDRVWTGFPQYENGKETIFAYQASANDGEPNGANSNFGDRLNFPHSGSPFGCCGFHQPSQNLVNYYQVDANGLPIALSNPNTWNVNNANYSAASAAIRATPVDPRLDWTVGRDSVPFKDWGIHEAGWIRQVSHGGPYSGKKNVHERASGAQSNVGWTNAQTNSDNVHIYRFADLMLMLAEAEVEAGTLANAQLLVDSVRARAGRAAQGCGYTPDNKVQLTWPQCAGDTRIAVPIDDPKITWATYRVGLYQTQGPWVDKATAREAVRAERRLELAMEGQRFFDLRRYGNSYAAAVLNGYYNGIGGGNEKARRPQFAAAELFTARHQLYPIPSLQISLSKVGGASRLKQNDGW